MDSQVRATKYAAADEVAAIYRARPTSVGIYRAGSLTAGLGNSRSDVDLYVISSDPASEAVVQHVSADERVDVEIRPRGWLTDLVAAVTTYDGSWRAPFAGPRLTQLDEAVRFLHADVLLDSPEIEQSGERLLAGADHLRRWLIQTWTAHVHPFHEDLLGWYEDGDAEEAMMGSQTLLTHAAQAYLAGCGDYYVGHKWVSAKLRRSAGPNFPHALWHRLLSSWPQDPREARQVVAERIRFSQALLVAAQTTGWEAPEASRWDHWGTSPEGVSRDVSWLPARFSDGILLARATGKPLRLSPQGLHLWGACDGRDRADVVQDLVAELAPAVLEEDVANYLERLVGSGVVAAEPRPGAAA